MKCNIYFCKNVFNSNTGLSTRKHSVINENFRLHWFLLSDDGCLCSRLLSQLSEKEREYQELLRNSVQRKQEQIDALRKASDTDDTGIFFC